MPALLRLIRNRLGRRGATLLVAAFVDIVYGCSFIAPESRHQSEALPTYRQLLDVAPLAVWGGIWLAVAVVCLVQAWMRRDAVAFGAAIAIKAVWATLMFVGWIHYHAPRGLLSAAFWGVMAGFVVVISGWREPASVPTGGGRG